MKTCITILSILSMILVASSVNAGDYSWQLDEETVKQKVIYTIHGASRDIYYCANVESYVEAEAYGEYGRSMTVGKYKDEIGGGALRLYEKTGIGKFVAKT